MDGRDAGPSRYRRHSGSSSSELSGSNGSSDYEPAYHSEDDDDIRSDSLAYQDAEDDLAAPEIDAKGKGTAYTAAVPSSLPNSPTRTRTESFSSEVARKEGSRSWTDLNLSIMVALISPIGNWLTGSDHVKHLCLLLLLIFYLHQLIEVPWQLYHKSRTRPSPGQRLRNGLSEVKHHAAELALSELRTLELVYLGLSAFAPFLGAHLIRYIFTAMEVDSLSWFSQTLFVLATGVRPWSHLIERLQQRTSDLQDAADRPINEERHRAVDEALAAIVSRLKTLETTLQEIHAKTEEIEPTREACEELTEAMGDLERFVHRHERKTELARVAHNNRLAVLETGLQRLEDRNRHSNLAANRVFRSSTTKEMNNNTFTSAFTAMFTYAKEFLQYFSQAILSFLPSYFLKSRARPRKRNSPSSSPLPSPPTTSDAQLSVSTSVPAVSAMPYFNGTPLETIPEDSDSEGTYVSETSPLSPRSTTIKLRTLGRGRNSSSRSRSRSISGPRKYPDALPSSSSARALELVATVAGWPYRIASGMLSGMMPKP